MAEKKKVAEWVDQKSVKVRPGQKSPWFEMIVTKKDGTEVKMIGRKVSRFYSESDESEEL